MRRLHEESFTLLQHRKAACRAAGGMIRAVRGGGTLNGRQDREKNRESEYEG